MKFPPTLQAYLDMAQAKWGDAQQPLPNTPLTTALELFRPQVNVASRPARRFLEPLIAATALFVLLVLSAISLGNFGMLVLCSGIAYTVLTQVFGLDLALDLPPGMQF